MYTHICNNKMVSLSIIIQYILSWLIGSAVSILFLHSPRSHLLLKFILLKTILRNSMAVEEDILELNELE